MAASGKEAAGSGRLQKKKDEREEVGKRNKTHCVRIYIP